jgi:hypothetical protein
VGLLGVPGAPIRSRFEDCRVPFPRMLSSRVLVMLLCGSSPTPMTSRNGSCLLSARDSYSHPEFAYDEAPPFPRTVPLPTEYWTHRSIREHHPNGNGRELLLSLALEAPYGYR